MSASRCTLQSLGTENDEGRSWTNPREVMKKLKKKKRFQRCSSLGKIVSSTVDKENGPLTASARQKLTLFSNSVNSPVKTSTTALPPDNCSPKPAKRPCTSCLMDISNSPSSKGTTNDTLSSVRGIPLDWSLKTKVRFTSPTPFQWASTVKTQQESEGVSRFVRGCTSAHEGVVAMQSELQQHLMVWTHPSLPSVKLYPRIESRLSAPTSQPVFMQDKQVLDSLRDNWLSSYRSLFHLLRTGYCPYFYLCANQFTALFLSTGVGGCSTVTALLTPTTSGLRQALRKEGVEFTLPLVPTSESISVVSNGVDTSGGKPPNGIIGGEPQDGSDNEDESTASSWLQSIGLATENFPSVEPNKIAFHRTRGADIDNRPESVVKVEGASVQALFNFFLNSKTLITTTGAHAGLPPTLLAPTAFLGGTLTALKTKQGTIQENAGGKMQRVSYIDISGPILPSTLNNLASLFVRTQGGDFTVHLNSIDSTRAFNLGSHENRGCPTEPPPAPPIPFDPYLTSRENKLIRKGLSEVKCKKKLFTCK